MLHCTAPPPVLFSNIILCYTHTHTRNSRVRRWVWGGNIPPDFCVTLYYDTRVLHICHLLLTLNLSPSENKKKKSNVNFFWPTAQHTIRSRTTIHRNDQNDIRLLFLHGDERSQRCRTTAAAGLYYTVYLVFSLKNTITNKQKQKTIWRFSTLSLSLTTTHP